MKTLLIISTARYHRNILAMLGALDYCYYMDKARVFKHRSQYYRDTTKNYWRLALHIHMELFVIPFLDQHHHLEHLVPVLLQ